MIFHDHEIQTLTALHPRRDEFLMYLYLLSDRVQEEDETAAEGIRFLCQIGAQPFVGRGGGSWFAAAANASDALKYNIENEEFRNYVPPDLDPDNTIHGSVGKCLETTIGHWTALTPDRRAELWEEWTPCATT